MAVDKPKGSPHVPLDYARIQQFISLLRHALSVEQGYSETDFSWTGLSKSGAERELGELSSDPDAAQALRTAFALARLRILSAAEELACVAQVLEEPKLAGIGAHVLARAAVETSARAAWLLAVKDGKEFVNPMTRIARSLGDRLYSACEAKRLAETLGLSNGSSGFAPEPEQIRDEAKAIGLTASFDMGAPRRGFSIRVGDARRINNTDLVRRLLRETDFSSFSDAAYAQLSAFTHATEYGLLHFYRSSPRAGIIDRVIDQRHIETAAGLSLLAWIAAMSAAVRVMGWGKADLDLYRHSVGRLQSCGPLARAG